MLKLTLSVLWISLIKFATSSISGPFFQSLDSSSGWIIGNDLWNITIGQVYGKKLFFQGQDLIGNAIGHYAGYGMNDRF